MIWQGYLKVTSETVTRNPWVVCKHLKKEQTWKISFSYAAPWFRPPTPITSFSPSPFCSFLPQWKCGSASASPSSAKRHKMSRYKLMSSAAQNQSQAILSPSLSMPKFASFQSVWDYLLVTILWWIISFSNRDQNWSSTVSTQVVGALMLDTVIISIWIHGPWLSWWVPLLKLSPFLVVLNWMLGELSTLPEAWDIMACDPLAALPPLSWYKAARRTMSYSVTPPMRCAWYQTSKHNWLRPSLSSPVAFSILFPINIQFASLLLTDLRSELLHFFSPSAPSMMNWSQQEERNYHRHTETKTLVAC